MANVTLDERDRAVLERLRKGDANVAMVAADVGCRPGPLRRRLPELADNGLVRRVDEGTYALTDSGERAIAASPAGTLDDRIDTPPEVQRRVESFDLRADREAAVLAAFAFLRYWGTASAGELIDGVYSEHPAGYESHGEWWTECVRDRLADLPSVEPPDASNSERGDASSDSAGSLWRYTGTSVVEHADEDGRVAPDDAAPLDSSARFAFEQLDLDGAERTAVRAAFDLLVHEGDVTEAEVESRVYPDHDAGYRSADDWWDDCVRPAFEALAGVERTDGGGWGYRPSSGGPASSGPGADAPRDLEPSDPEGNDE